MSALQDLPFSSSVSLVAVLIGVVTLLLLALALKRLLIPPAYMAKYPAVPWSFFTNLYYTFKPFSVLEKRNLSLEWSNLPVRRMFFVGAWRFIISSPELVKDIFTNIEVFEKQQLASERPNLPVSMFFGLNIVTTNGAEWRRLHKLVSPAFQTKNLIKISSSVFSTCTRILFSEFAKIDSKPIEVHDWMQRLTLDIIGHAGFSFDLGSLKNPDAPYVALYREIRKGLFIPSIIFFPWISDLPDFLVPRALKDVKEKITSFNSMMFEVIESRKKKRQEKTNQQEEAEAVDLLDLMLCSSELSSKELRDNLVIFFIAGHDTTASALACALHELGMYPEIQAKAYRHVLEVYQKSENRHLPVEEYIPSFEDTKHYDYINAIIKETLRLYPPVPFIPSRKLSKDATIGDLHLPKGALLSIGAMDLQRNPAVWGPDSEEFIPERFLAPDHPLASLDHYPEGSSKRTRQPTRNEDPMAFIAFGASHRSCPGQQFSLIEQRIVLATVLLRYELSIPAGFETLKFGGGGIISPKDVLINFNRRI